MLRSDSIFRSTFHRQMLAKLSPQLRRVVAAQELGVWVKHINFFSYAVRHAGDITEGAEVIVEVGGASVTIAWEPV